MGSGLLVAHVLEVAFHHSNGVNVANTADVGDGEVLSRDNTHVDLRGAGLTCAVGIRNWVVLQQTIKLDHGDVVVVSRVGHLAGGVVQSFTAQQEDVVIGARGPGDAGLCVTKVADLNGPVGVGLRRAKGRGNAVG